MAIKVALAQEEVAVEPGGSTQVVAIIQNAGDRPDHVALEVEGIDAEWCAIPIPSVKLEPGNETRERILIRPPRSSESRAGVYPFVVRVRSLENGESGVVQASLAIQPFNLLTLEINPKRGLSTYWRKQAFFDVTIANLGNNELNLQLFASDPEEACAFEFEHERVRLAPGEMKTLWLKVQPTQTPVLGAARLYGFTLSTRAVENPYLTSTAQGQLERRALISPTALWLFGIAFFFWMLWLFLRPKPVDITDFRAEPSQIVAGEKAILRFQVANADRVFIEPGVGVIDPQKVRSVEVQPQEPTTYKLIAENRYGQRGREVTIIVTKAPEPPEPKVDKFFAEPKQVSRGESIYLRWNVQDASVVYITPPGVEKDPAVGGIEHIPTRTTTYELIAKNSAGKMVSKKITVEVVEPALSEIIAFNSDRARVNQGESVRLMWEVKNASRVEIDNGVGIVDAMTGDFTVMPEKTTVYTLTAVDVNGRSKRAKVKVEVITPKPPPDPSPTDVTDPSNP